MKKPMRIKFAIIPLSLGLAGCQNEEARQHHLYNLQHCITETNTATAAYIDTMFGSQYVNGQLVLTPAHGLTAAEAKTLYDNVTSQTQHDYQVSDCMAKEEKTTIEHQQAKHDDYGAIPLHPGQRLP